MRKTDESGGDQPAGASDRAVWRRSQVTEFVKDEAGRMLDLAAFADARLDADEHERVAALLESDPAAAEDVAAAPGLAAAATPPSAALDRVIVRATALVAGLPPARGQVIQFAGMALPHPTLRGAVRWGSLAASIAIAGWLGFALGSDASSAYTQISRSTADDGFIGELFDPSTGILRSLTDGLET